MATSTVLQADSVRPIPLLPRTTVFLVLIYAVFRSALRRNLLRPVVLPEEMCVNMQDLTVRGSGTPIRPRPPSPLSGLVPNSSRAIAVSLTSITNRYGTLCNRATLPPTATRPGSPPILESHIRLLTLLKAPSSSSLLHPLADTCLHQSNRESRVQGIYSCRPKTTRRRYGITGWPRQAIGPLRLKLSLMHHHWL